MRLYLRVLLRLALIGMVAHFGAMAFVQSQMMTEPMPQWVREALALSTLTLVLLLSIPMWLSEKRWQS